MDDREREKKAMEWLGMKRKWFIYYNLERISGVSGCKKLISQTSYSLGDFKSASKKMSNRNKSANA